MPKTIVLDTVHVENVQLFRATIGEGETVQSVWRLGINYTLTGADGERQGGSKMFDLTEPQQANVRSFLKPFVAAVKVELDIQLGEAWAD